MAVEYVTMRVGTVDTTQPLWEEDVPGAADAFIEKIRKKGWHLRSVWAVKETIFVTAWRED